MKAELITNGSEEDIEAFRAMIKSGLDVNYSGGISGETPWLIDSEGAEYFGVTEIKSWIERQKERKAVFK